MGEAESRWDRDLAAEYQRKLNLRRVRAQEIAAIARYREVQENSPFTVVPRSPQYAAHAEAYQRLVNYYFNNYYDALMRGTPNSWLTAVKQESKPPEPFDEEKLLVEEDF